MPSNNRNVQGTVIILKTIMASNNSNVQGTEITLKTI